MEKKKMRTGVKVCLIISIVLTVLVLVAGFGLSGIIYSSCVGIDPSTDPMAETEEFFGWLIIFYVLIHTAMLLIIAIATVWGTYAMILLLKWLWKTKRPVFWPVMILYAVIVALVCTFSVFFILDFIDSTRIPSVIYPMVLK